MAEPLGTIAELWRYPVKGMRGESVASLELDPHGVAGDRRFAIRSTGAPLGKPLLTGAERAAMLLYQASGQGDETMVTVPGGEVFSIHDRRLMAHLRASLPGSHSLSMVQSATPLTDVRPVALLGSGTVAQLAGELQAPLDARRFRANILLQLAAGFAEDALAGQELRVGASAALHARERTPRCRMVILDPETAVADPALMKHLDRLHEGRVGMYATVAVPGTLRVGDAIVAA